MSAAWTDSQGFGSCLVNFLPASSIFNVRLVSHCHFDLTEQWRKAAVLWHRVRVGIADMLDPAVVLQGGFVLKHIELADWTGCGITALCPELRTSRILKPLPDLAPQLRFYDYSLTCGEQDYRACAEAVESCDDDECSGEGPADRGLFKLRESLDTHLAACVDLDFLKCLWTPQELVVCDMCAVRTRSSGLSDVYCLGMTHMVPRHTAFQAPTKPCLRKLARLLRYLDRGFRVRDVDVRVTGNTLTGYLRGIPLYTFSYKFADPAVDEQYQVFIANKNRCSLESLESLVHSLTTGFRTTGTEVRRVPV